MLYNADLKNNNSTGQRIFFGDSNSTISGYNLASEHLNITAEFFFSVIFSNQ